MKDEQKNCAAMTYGSLCGDCELEGICSQIKTQWTSPEMITADVIYQCRIVGFYLTNELAVKGQDWPDRLLWLYYHYLGRFVDEQGKEVFLPSEYLWIDPPVHDRIETDDIHPVKNLRSWYEHQLMTAPLPAENLYVTKRERWSVIASLFIPVFWELYHNGKVRSWLDR